MGGELLTDYWKCRGIRYSSIVQESLVRLFVLPCAGVNKYLENKKRKTASGRGEVWWDPVGPGGFSIGVIFRFS